MGWSPGYCSIFGGIHFANVLKPPFWEVGCATEETFSTLKLTPFFGGVKIRRRTAFRSRAFFSRRANIGGFGTLFEGCVRRYPTYPGNFWGADTTVSNLRDSFPPAGRFGVFLAPPRGGFFSRAFPRGGFGFPTPRGGGPPQTTQWVFSFHSCVAPGVSCLSAETHLLFGGAHPS